MRIITLLILAFISFTGFASQIKKQQIDTLVQTYHDLEQFNGVVLVAKNGKTILKKGYGKANFEWNIEHSVEGKFKIASLTKQFTAMLILQLAEKEQISLDAPLSTYLPNYREDTGKQITIRQLLNHTSGLANFFHLPKFKQIEAHNPYSLDEFIAKFCSEDLLFKPGTKFRYSNAGYTILGNVIEQVTNKPYSQVLIENIFTPAGMKSSGFNQQFEVLNNRVYGYERTLDGVKRPSHIDMSIPYSAGSIFSTLSDLQLWDRALAENALLSKKFSKILYEVTPHRNYGAGWLVDKRNFEKSNLTRTEVHHGGGINGFNARISRILEDDYLIVLFNNTGGAPMTPMTNNIINILYGEAVNTPSLRFTQKLYKMIDEQGTSRALTWYLSQVENENGLSERRLNYFSQDLIEVKRLDAAIEFLKLNAIHHAQSEQAHKYLAKAYVQNRNFKLAFTHLKKAQALSKTKAHYDNELAILKHKLSLL